MSEEIKDGQNPEGGPKKPKKVNRVLAKDLNAKIAEYEEKKMTHSVYYKHLIQRKNELERAAKPQ